MKQLFLIAPYTIDADYIEKRQIVKEICEAYAIRFSTAEEYKTEDILSTEKTIAQFENIDFFIADLSFERPSCYYEVGYIQAIKKKTFLIAQKGTIIHQVIGEVLYYTNLNEYRVMIEKIFEELGLSLALF